MIGRRPFLAGLGAATLAGHASAVEIAAGVTRLDPALDRFVAPGAEVEVLGRGYRWAEGPVWVPARQALLFSDVPGNVVHRWTPAKGVERFLSPSGLQGPVPAGVREAGANGLAIDHAGRLIIARSGTIYFTDPPYGLEGGEDSPLREQQRNGVYRLAPDGTVTLVDGELHRPNGIGLSPDGRTLYVSLSDEARPEVLAYTLGSDGLPTGRRLFCDMRAEASRGWPGLPDGMDVDRSGRVLATGPGGVHVLAPDGRRLGLIATGKAVANCCIGEGGRSLFLTSSDMLACVRLGR